MSSTFDLALRCLHAYRQTSAILSGIPKNLGDVLAARAPHYVEYIRQSFLFHASCLNNKPNQCFDLRVYYEGLDELMKWMDEATGFVMTLVHHMQRMPVGIFVDLGCGLCTLPLLYNCAWSQITAPSKGMPSWAGIDKRPMPDISPVFLDNQTEIRKLGEFQFFGAPTLKEIGFVLQQIRSHASTEDLHIFMCQVLHTMSNENILELMDLLKHSSANYIHVIDFIETSPLHQNFGNHIFLQNGILAYDRAKNPHLLIGLLCDRFKYFTMNLNQYFYLETFERKWCV